jgi:energy-coupling factor transporter ATP-binding protein EcfA2
MYSLSFYNKADKTSKPIAIIDGGRMDGKIISLQEENESILKKRPPKDIRKRININDHLHLFDGYKSNTKKRAIETVQLMIDDYDFVDMVTDESLLNIYREITSEKRELNPITQIELNDGLFKIYPKIDANSFELILIAGACGSGKSTIAKNYAELYHDIFPKNDIYLISGLNKDATLDSLPYIQRVKINSFLVDPPVLEEWSDSLVIFDDYENLESVNKPLYKVIIGLINTLASTGRHSRTRMIHISHKFTNYSYTRLLLEEATMNVIFTSSASNKSLELLLCKNGNLDKKTLHMIKKIKSRWIAYYRHAPNYFISEHDIWLMSGMQ